MQNVQSTDEQTTVQRPEFYGGIWWVTAHDAFGFRSTTPGECGAEIMRLRQALANAETEARRYASYYPQSSDSRNTFLLLADRIAEIARNG